MPKGVQVQVLFPAPSLLIKLKSRGPSRGSGFRQQAPASLTPAKRLRFKSVPGTIFSHQAEMMRSLALLGISPSGSRFAHACQTAQVQVLFPAPSFPTKLK